MWSYIGLVSANARTLAFCAEFVGQEPALKIKKSKSGDKDKGILAVKSLKKYIQHKIVRHNIPTQNTPYYFILCLQVHT